MKHTPLPWSFEKHTAGASIKGSGKEWIATLQISFVDDIEAKANAEFIVRACNSHYDLLEACKKVINNWGNLHPKDRQQLRNAVAKAEGKDDCQHNEDTWKNAINGRCPWCGERRNGG